MIPASKSTNTFSVSIRSRRGLLAVWDLLPVLGVPGTDRDCVDLLGVTKKPINAKFGVELDVEGFWKLMIEAISKY